LSSSFPQHTLLESRRVEHGKEASEMVQEGTGSQPANRVTAGTVSPDGQYYWSGERWVHALSPDGRWRWDGHELAAAHPVNRPSRAGSNHRRARALQVLFGLWIVTVLAELFVVFDYFVLSFTYPDGAESTFRWGIASSLLCAAIFCVAVWWFVPIMRSALSAIGTSRYLQAIVALWAGLFAVYVATDITLAEVVRGVAVDGPETRWQVLISAAVGIATAIVVVLAVGAITRAVSRANPGGEQSR
jgi:hypothetical protein